MWCVLAVSALIHTAPPGSIDISLATSTCITFQLYIRGVLISWVRANHEIHEIKTPRIFCRLTVFKSIQSDYYTKVKATKSEHFLWCNR